MCEAVILPAPTDRASAGFSERQVVVVRHFLELGGGLLLRGIGRCVIIGGIGRAESTLTGSGTLKLQRVRVRPLEDRRLKGTVK